jgi:hypothetical protein
VPHSAIVSHRRAASRDITDLESFGVWLEGETKNVLPKGLMGEAIAYARSNWTALSRYLEAPYLSIDNNATENAIRPIALGRKNRLHLGSDRGGHTAAMLLSLVQSCKNLGNEPLTYLRDVLDRVSTHSASRLDDLLPDRRVWPRAGPAGRRKGEIMVTPRKGHRDAVKQAV